MSTETVVRERPILFSGPMIRALLAGTKCQTRRVVKGAALEWLAPGMFSPEYVALPENGMCPYGAPGDRLVFLCTWAAPVEYDGIKPSRLPSDVRLWSHFDGTPKPAWAGRLRPGRFMPKWMRPRMPKGDLTDVRVQRVQEISDADCEAEGIYPVPLDVRNALVKSGRLADEGRVVATSRDYFRTLWDSINAARGYGWDVNPWCWCLTFRRVEVET